MKRISRETVLAVWCALGAVSCSDAVAPVTGAIRVAASTTGVDFDPDGYRISIGTDSVGWVHANESVIINGLTPGPRAVRLTGFALNCGLAPAPTPPLSVTVVASDTVDATFDVLCSANVGTLNVVPLSSGDDLDGDYLVSVDGGAPMEVSTLGLMLHGTPVGSHSLTLSGMASNCNAQPATIMIQVYFNQTTTASHLVRCLARLGGLRVQTTTTGVDSDPNGYDVEIQSVSSLHLAPNGTALVGSIREGNRTVTLTGVSANCTVSGSNPRSVMIAYGVITDLAFDVTCVAAAKVRVTVNTTGIDADQGYGVRVQGPEFDNRSDAPANGAITISGMGAGSHTVTFEDVAVNCDLSAGSANPRTITVTAGNTTDVVFDVACAVAPQVAFVSWFNGQKVASAKANGTAVTILTSAISDQHDPEYSPDGTRIAFRARSNDNTDIYVMNADGSGLTRITNNAAFDMNPAWSPDGSRIAFSTNRDGNHEIYVMNADGSNPTRLTTHISFDGKPSWSPDGSKIAFMSERSGVSHIYVMNADGSNVVGLTTFSGYWDGLPAWSPDGSKIAFVRAVECDDYYSGCHNIFVMNADGTGQVRFETRSHDSEPAWSPDGRWIAFETRYCGYYYCEAQSISAIKADGTGRTTILNGDHYNPAWRP